MTTEEAIKLTNDLDVLDIIKCTKLARFINDNIGDQSLTSFMNTLDLKNTDHSVLTTIKIMIYGIPDFEYHYHKISEILNKGK